MPELKFSARTHPELVRQVREWLATAEGERTMTDVITESSELTKDALRIIAAAAPAPVAESELVKTLTKLGLPGHRSHARHAGRRARLGQRRQRRPHGQDREEGGQDDALRDDASRSEADAQALGVTADIVALPPS